MDMLENTKKGQVAQGIEAVANEIVGQAHMEAIALNLFSFADQEDRKSNFSKSLVKSFYSANLLFDVIKQFGDVSEEIALKQKYAKWKATYINKCLQTGETPVPGPKGSEFDGAEFSSESSIPGGSTSGAAQPPSFPQPYNTNQTPYPPPAASYPSPSQPSASSYANYPPAASYQRPTHSEDETPTDTGTPSSGLGPDDFQQATKFCKYAISSLQYEDVSTAIDNLTKALRILKSNQ